MEKSVRQIKLLVEAGRKYASEGLLYEAAYRYGQAATIINTLYSLHASGTIVIDSATQSVLAPLRQKLMLMVESLTIAAGNGRHHKMGSKESVAKQSLLRVLDLLVEDVQGIGWF